MEKHAVIRFAAPPVLAGWACAGGPREAAGPLAAGFDLLLPDSRLGCASWEQAEARLLEHTVRACLHKTGRAAHQIDLALSGDLQAQCTASGYAMRQLGLPFAGVYGACSTMAETLALGACLCAGGAGQEILALTGSHFCAAERQFRMPLHYGGMRTPTAQTTATAAGCVLLHRSGPGVPVRSALFGRVQDLGVKDGSNMGAAMAPAAADTLLRYFQDTDTAPADFDVVFTGDLGQVGSELLLQLMADAGVPLPNHQDCGCLLYGADPRMGAGASGCGCSAAVLCSTILPRLQQGKYRRVLFAATGALMSQTTVLQKESIPGVAHLVELAAPAD